MGDMITYLITFLILAPIIALLWIGSVWVTVHGYEQIVDCWHRITRSEQ